WRRKHCADRSTAAGHPIGAKRGWLSHDTSSLVTNADHFGSHTHHVRAASNDTASATLNHRKTKSVSRLYRSGECEGNVCFDSRVRGDKHTMKVRMSRPGVRQRQINRRTFRQRSTINL